MLHFQGERSYITGRSVSSATLTPLFSIFFFKRYWPTYRNSLRNTKRGSASCSDWTAFSTVSYRAFPWSHFLPSEGWWAVADQSHARMYVPDWLPVSLIHLISWTLFLTLGESPVTECWKCSPVAVRGWVLFSIAERILIAWLISFEQKI